MKDFRDYIKLPLMVDVNNNSGILDSNNALVLTMDDEESSQARNWIISIINNEVDPHIALPDLVAEHNNGIVRINQDTYLLVRGYGYLTGNEKFNLTGEEALQVQHDFMDYIVNEFKNIL